ncbi:MAG: hypothetical protein FJ121_08595 [Deltaproteobacteria bacterium]|nr:hypothetical protein [Deltaproteobacteria bacterium]
MIIDPSFILSKEDIEKERTPEKLSLWWEEKNREFDSSPEGRQYALLKKGLTKEFYDEINPLKLFANILYAGRSDIGCIPNLGNDNFDAIIRDYSHSPPSEQKIEFTLAIDGHDDQLRMKYFVEHGHVSLTGPLTYTGTEKTGHKINVETEAVLHNDSLKKTFAIIKSRAEQKCKPKNYGKNHVLVITIDDHIAPRYDNQKDLEALNEFMKSDVINLPLDFGGLYILGLSGKTFLAIKIVI